MPYKTHGFAAKVLRERGPVYAEASGRFTESDHKTPFLQLLKRRPTDMRNSHRQNRSFALA
jgi:hypothetical protein